MGMGLEVAMFSDIHCNVTNFNIDFSSYHNSDPEHDGAIIIQAGSQYISLVFDNDGFVWIRLYIERGM